LCPDFDKPARGNEIDCVRFSRLAKNNKSIVVCDVTPCSGVEVFRRSSETSVTYQTPQRHSRYFKPHTEDGASRDSDLSVVQ
jgi:hypothetical protein